MIIRGIVFNANKIFTYQYKINVNVIKGIFCKIINAYNVVTLSILIILVINVKIVYSIIKNVCMNVQKDIVKLEISVNNHLNY